MIGTQLPPSPTLHPSAGQGPPVTAAWLGVVFPLHRVLVLPRCVAICSQWPGDICWNADVCCQAKQMQEDLPEWGRRDRVGGRASWGADSNNGSI